MVLPFCKQTSRTWVVSLNFFEFWVASPTGGITPLPHLDVKVRTSHPLMKGWDLVPSEKLVSKLLMKSCYPTPITCYSPSYPLQGLQQAVRGIQKYWKHPQWLLTQQKCQLPICSIIMWSNHLMHWLHEHNSPH